ncbi:TetR/AcrR family transcriptional regulator [Nocardia otitidiscaviarum]|uniref:TetR/AcrR family transcriptional regulator n=1 Tax=Nocardia otitidiscaviarum TaxID=1823 RepID=A0A516NRQ1_9NOCA|nr:TetR/AcrR family transcriptional regulator [Nocardia otitidiscaviarum]MCP9620785.1 TetR/AcrR family transcriptional regulator [Nocardia otitidiscaviarum]QDP81585.1 TetR/AcrR family transcriptional regulator [Nocardia otitidiscaviarum]
MPRLTRSESQARTRADLLATARDLFLTDGYAKTSLERVADEAGYSKGAVYSNFRTKSQLCLEVLELIHETKFGEVSALLAAHEAFDERMAAFQDWAERTLGDIGWTMLEFEFAIVARDDPALQAALVSNLSLIRGTVAAQLQRLAGSLGIALPMPPEDAATAVLSLGLGLGIQRAIDPSLSARLITDAVRSMITPGAGGAVTPGSAGSTRLGSAAG